MSHFARPTAVVFVLAAACSGSKPPEGKGAQTSEAPVASGDPEAPPEPPASVPAPGAPVEGTPGEAAPTGSAPGEPPATSAPEANEPPTIATLFVRDRLADCEAEGARQCLMVRGSEGEQWRNFHGAIEGFAYEPRYAYELRVAVTHVANPPPDAPSIHYKLVEVVSKKKTSP